MSELLFACVKCAQPLVIDAAHKGRWFECPGCAIRLQVPAVAREFACTHCGAALAVPRQELGHTRHCPACAAELVMPWGGHRVTTCPVCGRELHVDWDREQDPAGTIVRCQHCHADAFIGPGDSKPRLARPADRKPSPVGAAPAPAAAPPPASPSADADAAGPGLPGRPCIHCGRELAAETVLCVACGTNQVTGETFGAADA